MSESTKSSVGRRLSAFRAWLHRKGAFVSVIGAVLILVGTVVEKRYRDKYADAKAQVESVRRDSRNQIGLGNQSYDSFANYCRLQIIKPSKPFDPDDAELFEKVMLPIAEFRGYCECIKSQLEVAALLDESSQEDRETAKAFREVVRKYPTAISDEIAKAEKETWAKIDEQTRRKNAGDRNAGVTALKNLEATFWRVKQETDPKKFEKQGEAAQKAFEEQVNKVQLPSKNLLDAADRLLERHKHSQRLYGMVAICLYVAGSVLALYGQWFDKTKPAAQQMPPGCSMTGAELVQHAQAIRTRYGISETDEEVAAFLATICANREEIDRATGSSQHAKG